MNAKELIEKGVFVENTREPLYWFSPQRGSFMCKGCGMSFKRASIKGHYERYYENGSCTTKRVLKK